VSPHILLWFLAIAVLAAPASGDPRQAAEDFLSTPAVSAGAREADATIDRIETIREEIAADRDEVASIDRAAQAASPGDLPALQARAARLRLEMANQLTSFVAAVEELEAGGGDARPYREQLAELLPELSVAAGDRLDAEERALSELREELGAAPPEARMPIQQRIARETARLAEAMDVAVNVVAMMEQLGVEDPAARESLVARLDHRALVTAGRLELDGIHLADAQALLSATPDDATLAHEAQVLAAQLRTDSEQLAADLDRMDRLGLPTARYKQLLIASTGEVTADVFEPAVALGLLSRWLTGAREAIGEAGPGVLFETLLFLLVIAAATMLSRVARRIAARAVAAPQLRFSELLKRMIVSSVSGGVLLLGVLVAFSQLGLEIGPLLAGLGIAGFIVGFALQDTLANFAAGVMILAYRPFDVGNLIDCAGGVFGTVSRMNLVSTTILTIDNQTKVVPNGKIWGDVITNVTAQKRRRVDLMFGIGYADDVLHAEQVLVSIVKEHPKVLSDPAAVVRVHELGDSSVNFVVRPWCERADYWDVYWDITREVKLRFDREGISIPFPQRDVHLHPVPTDGGLRTADVRVGDRAREPADPAGTDEPAGEDT